MILADVKLALGIRNDKKDDDIACEIEAAKQRLRTAGCKVVDDSDALTASAIKAYCKGVFNYQGNGEQWLNRFEDMLKHMPLAIEYGGDSE